MTSYPWTNSGRSQSRVPDLLHRPRVNSGCARVSSLPLPCSLADIKSHRLLDSHFANPRSGESRAYDLTSHSAQLAPSLADAVANGASVTRDVFLLGASGNIDRN